MSSSPPVKQIEKAVDLGPIDIKEFSRYMNRDLDWLDGFAAALVPDLKTHLGNRVHSMRRILKRLAMNTESDSPR